MIMININFFVVVKVFAWGAILFGWTVNLDEASDANNTRGNYFFSSGRGYGELYPFIGRLRKKIICYVFSI